MPLLWLDENGEGQSTFNENNQLTLLFSKKMRGSLVEPTACSATDGQAISTDDDGLSERPVELKIEAAPTSSTTAQLAQPPFKLHAAFPNPAHDEIFIPFDLPTASAVSISIFNAMGQLVARENIHFEAGEHRFRQSLEGLSGGFFTLVLNAASGSASQKIVVEK